MEKKDIKEVKLSENKEVKKGSKKKLMDGVLLNMMSEELKTDFYTLGAYTEYNGLDVKNLKNPVFDKK